ncbi:MAG: hypothetical protein K0R66_1237 [Gammaproteobacteria bacterium]|nr:hypothetical protein [Gammaproteobacteria bacterium]
MKLNRSKFIKLGIVASAAASCVMANVAMATTIMSFSELQANIAGTAGNIWRIVQTIITIAGLLLVVKGLVHLKQNYTGTGQEKHLSKGIASLVFGACLFLVIPITHVLVGGVSGDPTGSQGYNTFDTGADSAQAIS